MSTVSPLKQNFGFGTFKGVFIPNVTMMFGVILFLRLGIVLGNVGMWQFSGIIALALTIMVITSMSIAMVVTNMEMGGGGAYFIISRSLGVEIGGAIGIALIISQLVSLALCTSGFAYSLVELFPQFNIHIVETVTLIALAILSFFSANLALRTQTLIFCILMASLVAVFITSGPVSPQSTEPYLPHKLAFWGGFAMFYPALTGIEAGMAMSGNLKNPSRSLSIGSIISVVVAAVIYFSIALFLWLHYDKNVLASEPMLLVTSSSVPMLIYAGIWAASLSTSLGNLVGGPRMLQMLGEDGVVPKILGRGYGKHREPRYAIGIFFIVALTMMLFTTIDQIIPILTMFCLLTYGTLNFVAAMEELIHGPTWRPAIRYPWQICLLGAVLCLFVMAMIDPMMTFISFCIVFGVYAFLRSRSLEVSFEDFRENILFFFSRIALYRLSESQDHPTKWLPQVLLFSRTPDQNENAIYLAQAITQRSGLMTVASVVPEVWEDPEILDRTKQTVKQWLSERSIECITEVFAHQDYYEGMASMAKTYGIGSFQPNTLLYSMDKTEQEAEGALVLLDAAQTYAKNILFYFDAPKNFNEPSPKPKVIDLWWDPEHRESFELMLSYLMAMRMSPVWRNRHVNLWSVAPDSTAKKYMETHFRQLFKDLRIRVKVKIRIETEGDALDYVGRYSKRADLIFFPLRPMSDYPDTYGDYLKHVIDILPDSIPVLAVTSYDQIDHREIYR